MIILNGFFFIKIGTVKFQNFRTPLTSTKQIVGVWYGGALDTFCFPNIGGGGGAVRGGYFKRWYFWNAVFTFETLKKDTF